MVRIVHQIGYIEMFLETGLKFKLRYVDTCKTYDEFNIKSKYLNGKELELLIEINHIHKNMFDSAYKSLKRTQYSQKIILKHGLLQTVFLFTY